MEWFQSGGFEQSEESAGKKRQKGVSFHFFGVPLITKSLEIVFLGKQVVVIRETGC